MSRSARRQAFPSNLYSMLRGDRRGFEHISIPGLGRGFELDGVCVLIYRVLALAPFPCAMMEKENTIDSIGRLLRFNFGR